MTRSVKLIGLDFGTTTSSAVVASAQLAHNVVTGRTDLTQLRESYRSEMVFTPLRHDTLDLDRLAQYIDAWLAAGQGVEGEIVGGGALLTGLTAQCSNADGLVLLINDRLGDALIAAAQDPCFESWLAFMGSCAGLSRENPDMPIINLDIGGGTTNIALGKAGEVLRTGSLFVGARHVQVEPGTYRIVKLSRYAIQIFDDLGITKGTDDFLTPAEVERIVDFYAVLLEAAVNGDRSRFREPAARIHEQVAFRWPSHGGDVGAIDGEACDRKKLILTVSGGVGELLYSHVRGRPWPPTTFYGDLGIDLARRLMAIPQWAEHFRTYLPAGGGRATVYGLLRHSTQVSGNTVFLPDPSVLPIRNVPIFGSISPDSSDADIHEYLGLAVRNPSGGALIVRLGTCDTAAARALGKRMAEILLRPGSSSVRPVVLVVDQNFGKVLGHCVTDWGRVPINLVVVDEITVRDAQFVQLGRLQNQVVPVSFFGIRELAGAS